MKRKLFAALFAMCFMGLASFAQTNSTEPQQEAPKFERYSFFSQWTLNLNGGAFINLGNMGTSASYGFGAILAKPLNHIWNVRFQYIYGNLDGSEVDVHNMFPSYTNGKLVGSVNELNMNFTFSLTDLFGGYQPKRFLGIYLLAGGGANFVSGHIETPNGNTIHTLGGDDEIQINPLFNAGLGFKFRLSDSWALNLESSFKFMPEFWDENFVSNQPAFYNYTSLGVTYDLGICPSVKARIDAEKQLALDKAAAEKEQMEREKEECDKAKQNEKKLKDRISELEKEMNSKINNQVTELKKENDALKASLNDIKANQGTFYALPFSVVFGVNEYAVSSREQSKLKAIAKVMNDNPNIDFSVVGFADYTGSDAYNDKLSKKRAESVVNVLVKKYKVDSNRLKVDSKGKREAFGDIKLDINRRVSFFRVIK